VTTWHVPTKSEDQISHEAIKENSMTEVEKLRALLAEAQNVLMHSFAQGLDDPHACSNMAAHINAALAEPVAECARCETLRDLADKAAWAQGDAQRRMIEAQTQRDEGRAEVERLQAELTRVGRVEFDRGAKQGIDQALWASQTARETAFQRGAEAMREAAAKWLADRELHQGYWCADVIRSLPLPEVKP